MNVLTAIVLLSPCVLVTLVLLFLVAIRYIVYRERAALAQYGIFHPEESFWDRLGQRTPKGILWGGVITAMCGLAILLGLITIGLGPWLLGGLLPLFVGLGMLFIYFTGGAARDRGAGKAKPQAGAELEQVENE